MSRRRAWIWIAFGLVCALAAAGLAFVTLQQQQDRIESEGGRQPTATPVPSFPLPVAKTRLEVGKVVTDEDVEFRDYPLHLIPSSAVSQTSVLAGKVLVEPIAQGDFFRLSSLSGMDTSAQLSRSIPQGKEIFAFPATDLLATGDVIRDGDHVDLLLTVDLEQDQEGQTGPARNPNKDKKLTGYTVQNVEVFRVMRQRQNNDEEGATPPPAMLLLLLEPRDMLYVKFTKDFGGILDLALRSPLDKEPFRVPPVRDTDLVELMETGRVGGN